MDEDIRTSIPAVYFTNERWRSRQLPGGHFGHFTVNHLNVKPLVYINGMSMISIFASSRLCVRRVDSLHHSEFGGDGDAVDGYDEVSHAKFLQRGSRVDLVSSAHTRNAEESIREN